MENNLKKIKSTFIGYLIFAALLLLSFGQRPNIFAQDIKLKEDIEMANKAADNFFKIYLENQKPKSIFDNFISKKTINGLRKTAFFEDLGFNVKLVKKLDDQTLLNVYQAMMNSYFVGTLYNEHVLNNSKNESDSIPDDVVAVYTKSRIGKQYLKKLNDGKESSKPIVNTTKDQIEYIKMVNEASIVLEKHLPKHLFDSAEFKNKYKDYCHENRCNATITNSGDEQFDIGKGVAIYIVNKYPFTIHFVKEKNEMKILRFGIGN